MKTTDNRQKPCRCTGNCYQGRFCDCAPDIDHAEEDRTNSRLTARIILLASAAASLAMVAIVLSQAKGAA